MNQEKIGKFIAQRRKAAGLTQMQLAEKLGVTDRAVSKWETGKAMPDVSLMLTLCAELQISVNDLLHGEEISMANYNEEAEKMLFEMVKQKEEADKRLLRMEIVVGVVCIAFLLAMTVVAAYVPLKEWLRVIIVAVGLIPLLVALPFMLKVEQEAGYYECAECGHRYVPSFKSVLWSMHMGRTRYMKCPNCGKKSWQKKVISKK